MTREEALRKARRIWGKRAMAEARQGLDGKPVRTVGFLSRVIPAFCVQGRAETWEAAFREWEAKPEEAKRWALWECGKINL